MQVTASRIPTKHYYLAAFAVLCLLLAVDDALGNWRDLHPSAALVSAGRFWMLPLLALWVEADSREQGAKVYRPYEFGFFVFMFWLPYVPYYFWRTRGLIGAGVSAAVIGALLLADLSGGD